MLRCLVIDLDVFPALTPSGFQDLRSSTFTAVLQVRAGLASPAPGTAPGLPWHGLSCACAATRVSFGTDAGPCVGIGLWGQENHPWVTPGGAGGRGRIPAPAGAVMSEAPDGSFSARFNGA